MRIMIKGGVWKNTEDEILKAAVMKYGKNQWSRIASLLSRKSAKQCKARWYEWLDPSIKKTEWTREEDEKLLHLAKIMPTQWRTIAPIVGRTAAQCLERYEKLLDEAMRTEGQAPDDADDPRRLRPGEIDPNPECKPARPDPVDMDEDEKEMLSEARARLANTRGKKAKRKAREKQLEEARRLASLQKRRELKAAGVDVNKRRKRRDQIDYATEVPFQHTAPLGFYEVDGEHSIVPQQNLMNVSLKDLEGARRTELESKDSSKDKVRARKKKKEDLPGAILSLNRMNDPQHVTKRARMVLPAPMVTDKELEQIAKAGALLEFEGGGSGATGSLLGSYTPGGMTPAHGSQTPANRVARTPMRETSIQDEVRAVAALNRMTGPLMGGESGRDLIQGKDFGGITPSHKSLATPNIMAGGATPIAGGATPARSEKAGGMTPAMSLTGGETPMLRDALSLNAGDGGGILDENVGLQRAKEHLLKQQLKHSLKALPAPKNEYEIDFAAAIPEQKPEQEENAMEEDAQDIRKRLERESAAADAAERKRRSAAVQRDLPRPLQVNAAYGKGSEGDVASTVALVREASKMVQKELLALLKHDSLAHPVPSGQPADGAVQLEAPGDDFMAKARALVDEEMKSAMSSSLPSAQEFSAAYASVTENLVYVPSTRQMEDKTKLSSAQMVEVLKYELEVASHHVTAQDKKAKKAEAKLDKLTTGYYRRSLALKSEADQLLKEKEEAELALQTYKLMHAYEQAATPLRFKAMTELCEVEATRESNLQKRYADLVARKKAAA